MRSIAESCGTPSFVDHQPAVNTDAVATVNADSEQYWVLDWICWSYSDVPTGGSLTVAIGGTTYLEVDITAAGPGMLEFERPLYNSNFASNKNQSLVVTLAAGGASVEGKVNIRYR